MQGHPMPPPLLQPPPSPLSWKLSVSPDTLSSLNITRQVRHKPTVVVRKVPEFVDTQNDNRHGLLCDHEQNDVISELPCDLGQSGVHDVDE